MPPTTKEPTEMPPKNQLFWLTTDAVSVEIAASADRLYDLVADLPRMGNWSNECRAVEWTGGATGPAVGARFVGHNAIGPRGMIKWSRKGRVLVADPGREFAFVTEEGGREGVVWRYRFTPSGDSTRVTESYEVKWLPVKFRVADVFTNRYRSIVGTMRHTLKQLKVAAEKATPTPGGPT
jgi:hypothetical protein